MNDKPLPLASRPFWTLQGEGHLTGKPMAFVRLAGCSIGCPGCDTDYVGRLNAMPDVIAVWCNTVTPNECRDRWVWITGGEPTDHDLIPLVRTLHDWHFSVALATAGHRRVIPPVDWLSVSPHDPSKWVQLFGHEVKLISGLNGFDLDDFIDAHPDSQTDFFERFIQPLSVNGAEDPESLQECLEWLKKHPNWGLSRQNHLVWGVP